MAATGDEGVYRRIDARRCAFDLDTTIKTVDHAAHQDDRWAFVAQAIIGMVTICLLTRYFMCHDRRPSAGYRYCSR